MNDQDIEHMRQEIKKLKMQNKRLEEEIRTKSSLRATERETEGRRKGLAIRQRYIDAYLRDHPELLGQTVDWDWQKIEDHWELRPIQRGFGV